MMRFNRPSADAELKRLEKRIDDLVSAVVQLKDENRALRQRQDALTAERATLLQKNEQVRAQRRSHDWAAEGDGARYMSEHRHGSACVSSRRSTSSPARTRSAPTCSIRRSYLNGKMREIRDSGKVVGLDRIAVMAALNMANELLKTGRGRRRWQRPWRAPRR